MANFISRLRRGLPSRTGLIGVSIAASNISVAVGANDGSVTTSIVTRLHAFRDVVMSGISAVARRISRANTSGIRFAMSYACMGTSSDTTSRSSSNANDRSTSASKSTSSRTRASDGSSSSASDAGR